MVRSRTMMLKAAFTRLRTLRAGSLREKIALLYGSLFAVVLVSIMVLVSLGIERLGEENATRDLAANARVFDELLDLRAIQLRGKAKVLARAISAFAKPLRPAIHRR